MNSAIRQTVSTFGVIMGIAGMEHGLGEFLQGNSAPSGLIFLSWPDSAFFRIMGGEPAMSIIPNLMITGILALLFSAMYIVTAVWFIRRPNIGMGLIALAIAMLLAGGGIFPPVLAGMLGGVSFATPVQFSKPQQLSSIGTISRLHRSWSWAYGICLLSWLLLFPGINILSNFFSVNNMILFLSLVAISLGSLICTCILALMADRGRAAQEKDSKKI